jgi:hypothetical protein
MSTAGLIDLICVCRVNGKERRATYSAVSPELLRDGDPVSLRLMLQTDLQILLGEPALELVSIEALSAEPNE